MELVAETGNLEIIEWFNNNTGMRYKKSNVLRAACMNKDVYKWLKYKRLTRYV